MKWRCWTCQQDFTTSNHTDRPEHCTGASFTPHVEEREPNLDMPTPNAHGDHEDVVMYMVVRYGGTFGVRAQHQGGPLSIAVYVPPAPVEPSALTPAEHALCSRVAALNEYAKRFQPPKFGTK